MLLVILEFLVKDKQRNDVEIIKDLKIKHIYITIMEFKCHETKKKKNYYCFQENIKRNNFLCNSFPDESVLY